MPKMYSYVGPPEILARSHSSPKGVPIKNADDLQDWIKATGQRPESQIVATYVIDKDGLLLIADRRFLRQRLADTVERGVREP